MQLLGSDSLCSFISAAFYRIKYVSTSIKLSAFCQVGKRIIEANFTEAKKLKNKAKRKQQQ